MPTQIGIILGILALAYALPKARRLPVEISMFLAALVGGLAGIIFRTPPAGELIRHLVEGSATYLDVILVFSTATIFMAIVNESGGVNYVGGATIRAFHNKRLAALIALRFI